MRGNIATKKDKVFLVLGDQLYQNVDIIKDNYDKVVLLESYDFNNTFKYHKKRIVHCFVAMREYADYLRACGVVIEYITIEESVRRGTTLSNILSENVSELGIWRCEEKEMAKYLQDLAFGKGIDFKEYNTCKFLTNDSHWQQYREINSKRLVMNDFYIFQRKRLKILVDDNLIPQGGKWSFDEDNRSKIAKSESGKNGQQTIPQFDSTHLIGVSIAVEKYFSNNYGDIGEYLKGNELLTFPVTYNQSLEALDLFFKNKFNNYGKYQDAIEPSSVCDPFLYHSLISSSLNNGLLLPKYVIDKAISYGILCNTPLNSVEGFVRQIIGWREWVNLLYLNVYDQDLKSYNFFNHHKPLPAYFYNPELMTAKEKENTPLYEVLTKVNTHVYAHHIERLMILGNWMTLNEYDPYECYKWFMEMFIDSYQWVMVANVYGMGLFADGGIFSTKPYISGGNYIKKMSNYSNSKIWENTWTELFWSFLFKHEQYFKKHPRLAMLIISKTKKQQLE